MPAHLSSCAEVPYPCTCFVPRYLHVCPLTAIDGYFQAGAHSQQLLLGMLPGLTLWQDFCSGAANRTQPATSQILPPGSVGFSAVMTKTPS